MRRKKAQAPSKIAQLQERYARLEREIEARRLEVRETIEQQTATSEILRVISGSRTDAQPFSTRSCGALSACATHGLPSSFDWRASSFTSPLNTTIRRRCSSSFGARRTGWRRAVRSWRKRCSVGSRPHSRHRAQPGGVRGRAGAGSLDWLPECARGAHHARGTRARAIAVTRSDVTGAPKPSRVGRSSCSRPSLSRPSSPSRTCASSRSWRPGPLS